MPKNIDPMKQKFTNKKPCKICGEPTYFETHVYCQMAKEHDEVEIAKEKAVDDVILNSYAE